MAILSRFETFATAGDCSQLQETYNLGTYVDLGSTVPGDISLGGRPVYLVVEMVEAFAGASSTMAVRLVSDATTSISTANPTVHAQGGPMAVAALTAGAVAACFALPGEGPAYERYLGVQIIIGGATSTAGTANAYLTMNPPKWVAHADGAPTVA